MIKEKIRHADMGSQTEIPTILIAEDHPMISIMLADMIDHLVTRSEIVVVENMEKARAIQAQPDLIIADLDLPDSKGVNTINNFAALFPQCPKLICSGVLDRSLAIEAERAGYFYVNKASTYPELLRALQNLLTKAGVLNEAPKGVEKVTSEYHSNIYAPGSDKPLTWKQVEIMRKTAEGLSAKEVAREMDISPDTVRGHIKEIFLRLGAKNKGQAVDIFIRAERKARLLDS
jgi:DNA-binding NarL/FixJ family response regulator